MDASRDQSCRSRFNGKASPDSASGDGNPFDFAKEKKISRENRSVVVSLFSCPCQTIDGGLKLSNIPICMSRNALK